MDDLDEYLLSTMHKDDDDAIVDIEKDTLTSLYSQIVNMEMTGMYDKKDDILIQYITRYLHISEGSIDDLEAVLSDNSDEDQQMRYDTIVLGLVEILGMIGIRFDLESENIFFKDLYSAYVVLVLNIKKTIIKSFKYYTMNTTGIDNNIATRQSIIDKFLTEEFIISDMLIQNICEYESEVYMRNIHDKMTLGNITIDNTDYGNYITKYIINEFSD